MGKRGSTLASTALETSKRENLQRERSHSVVQRHWKRTSVLFVLSALDVARL